MLEMMTIIFEVWN